MGSSPVFTSCYASLHLHLWHVQSLSRAKPFSNKAVANPTFLIQDQGKPLRLSVTCASSLSCRLTLVPPHPYCLWRTGFFFDAKMMEYSVMTFPIRSTLRLVNGLQCIWCFCFGRHGASAHTLAFLPSAFRLDFIQHKEVATLTTDDNRDCCKKYVLSSSSSVLQKRYSKAVFHVP